MPTDYVLTDGVDNSRAYRYSPDKCLSTHGGAGYMEGARVEGEWVICPACGLRSRLSSGWLPPWLGGERPCWDCCGLGRTGFLRLWRCDSCGGSGRYGRWLPPIPEDEARERYKDDRPFLEAWARAYRLISEQAMRETFRTRIYFEQAPEDNPQGFTLRHCQIDVPPPDEPTPQ